MTKILGTYMVIFMFFCFVFESVNKLCLTLR